MTQVGMTKQIILSSEDLRQSLIDHGDQMGGSIIHKYARAGNFIGCNDLITSWRHLNIRDENGFTPLHYASIYEHHILVYTLLGWGANPNLKNDYGKTPLHYIALHNEDSKCMSSFLEKSDLNLRDSNGNTPLHDAALAGNELIANILLNHNANFTIKNKKGLTSKEVAIWNRNDNLVELISSFEYPITKRANN
jgi:uncharacterized protein